MSFVAQPHRPVIHTSSAKREAVLVVLGMTVITLIMTYPVVRVMTTSLPNDLGDPLLNTWLLAWDADRLRHGLAGLWNLPSFFPYQRTLLYNEPLLGIALFVSPLTWATGNPVLSYNVAFILAFIVAGAGMYALVRSLTGRWDAAWLAGLIYAFCPYRMSQLSRVQVLTSGWLAVALWALHRYFRDRSRRWIVVCASAFLVQALSNGYSLYFSLAALLIVGAAEWWQSDLTLLKLGADLVIPGALVIVVLGPIAAAYVQVHRDPTLMRSYEEITSYRADFGSYLRAPESIRVWRVLPGLVTPEGYLFPGLTAIALAVLAGTSRRRDVTTYAAVATAGFVLSLGPAPSAWGHTLFRHAPYEWLLRVVPGFNGLRVPARFGVLVFLGLAVMAGIGAGRLLDRIPQTTRGPAVMALSLAILIEGWGAPLPVAAVPPMTASDRGAYQWLRNQPQGAAVEFPIQRPLSHSPLIYPTRDPSGYLNTIYQYRTLMHHHPIVNGFSGYEPLLNVMLRRLIQEGRLGEALRMLRSVGVRYANVHPPASSSQSLPAISAADVAAQTDEFTEQIRLGDTTVFRLKPWAHGDRTAADAKAQQVPATSLRLSASPGPDRIARAIDGDLATRWTTGAPQAGNEWVEIQLDRPRPIVRIELDLGGDFSDYPRHLTVDGWAAQQTPVRLFDGTLVAAVAQGLLRQPSVVPVEIVVGGIPISTLRLEATARSTWAWSIHELTLWERP